MSSQHVLIIGAGICGLAIAHGLAKAGIAYTIFDFEEESAFRPREWTMALHWSMPMLKELLPENLANRLEVDAVVDPYIDYTTHPNNVVGIYDGADDGLVSELPTLGVRVSRRKLRALCSEQVTVQWGHKLQSIEYRKGHITAIFSNGERREGTLLIGADGARSHVREHTFPGDAKTTPLDILYTNVAFQYQDSEKASFVRQGIPVATIVVHPESTAFMSVQDVKDRDRPETWSFQMALMWKGLKNGNETSDEIRSQIEQRAKKLSEPFRSAFLWMPLVVEPRYYELGYWAPPTRSCPIHDGRVALAGDAAHSMPPHRGQGLNNALNDAYNFVQAVKRMTQDNQSRILQGYANEVAERGAKEVELSRSTAETLTDHLDFRQSALLTMGVRKSE